MDLRTWRTKIKRWSQAELALQLSRAAGIRILQDRIARYECGRQAPSAYVREVIAKMTHGLVTVWRVQAHGPPKGTPKHTKALW